MGGGAVAGTAIGHQLLDHDPVRAVEGDRSPEEADNGLRLLVGQHLGIGQAGGVVNADMNPVSAGLQASHAGCIGLSSGPLCPTTAEHPVTGSMGPIRPSFLTSM